MVSPLPTTRSTVSAAACACSVVMTGGTTEVWTVI